MARTCSRCYLGLIMESRQHGPTVATLPKCSNPSCPDPPACPNCGATDGHTFVRVKGGGTVWCGGCGKRFLA